MGNMKLVPINASSLIDNNLSKNIRLCTDFVTKKLNLSVTKSESMANIETEILELLKPLYPDISLVHRDINYDLLNIAIQNILQQAKTAMENSKPKEK
jgi:hypothetical protein